MLTAFGALVVFFITCAGFIFGVHGHIKGRLRENPGYRQRIACKLEEPKWSAPYLRGLDWALGRLDEIMGPINVRSGALQGFGFCLMLALVYSSVFLIFGWGLFGASGQIGTLDALPEWDGRWRALFALAVLLYGVVVFYVFRRIRAGALALAVAEAGAAVGAVALGGVLAVAAVVAVAGAGAGAGVLAVALALALALAGAVAGAPAVALAVAGAIAGAVAVAGAVALTVIIAGAGAPAVAPAGVLAVAVAGAAAGAIALAGAAAGAVALAGAFFGGAQFLVLLLWLALPVANAGPDVISWWVSRWLGRHMRKTIGSAAAYSRKLVSFAGHVFLDLVAAGLFFGLLAWLMPRIVDGVNVVARSAASNPDLPLWEVGGLVCQTALDPWGEGAWPMMMLLSTLVPTAFHFAMALLGPLVALWLKWFRAPDVAAQLRAVPSDYCGEGPGGAAISQAIDDAASKLTWAWFWAIITGAVIVATLWIAWRQIEHALPPLGYAINAGLDGFKRWMLWVAYGFDWEPVGACLGA